MVFEARPMIPAERYFAFLDRVVPMNLLLVADLDIVFEGGHVEAGWRTFSALRSATRIRTRADLTVADGPPSTEVHTRITHSADWDAALADESRALYGWNRPMRCVYLPSPDQNRSRLVLAVHHAVLDGRIGIGELQQFLRFLAGQQVPEQRGLTVVGGASASFPWQVDRTALRDLLRELGARNAVAGEVQPAGWPRPDLPRSPRFHSMTIDGDDAGRFLAAAKARRTRAYSAMAAAWLTSAGRHLAKGSHEPTVQLATPVDLATSAGEPGVLSAPVVGIVAARLRLPAAGGPWALAPTVSTAIDDARGRGEGELFFHLTRAATISDVDKGAAAVRRSLASTPPSVSVTNLGVVDPGSDPDWVYSMCGFLCAAPNNVIFVSGLGYRGRLVHSVSWDDTQLDAADAGAMIDGYRSTVAEMSSA